MLTGNVYAQSTYEDVRAILTTKCDIACHGDNSFSFNITDSAETLYDSLLNAKPINPYAAGNNYALISPGYPDRSFLLRKVANCISADLATHPDEGALMPENAAPLALEDIELIRQWILYGAPDTGVVMDKALIQAYYQNPSRTKVERPTPPKSCEGFQIHLGPIFYAPGEEKEYFIKYDLNIPDTLEIISLYSIFNQESHHFGYNKYINNTGVNRPQGLILEGMDDTMPGDKVFIGFSENGKSNDLPNGTAFFINPNESLDLNFHLFNPYGIPLAGEAYVNVYTQPKGFASKEVKSGILHNFFFAIPNNSQPTIINYDLPIELVSLITLTSHAHSTCTNFDIYLRNSDGTKGKMIYDGSYNYLQGFDSGVYDYQHPPVIYFEPFLDLSKPVNNGTVPEGLIMEATYFNDGSDTLYFGVTTKDEMMAAVFQYVDSSFAIPANAPWTPTCIETYIDPCFKDTTISTAEIVNSNHNISLNTYPNPSSGNTTIYYHLPNAAGSVKLDLVNLMGARLKTFIDGENQPAGDYSFAVNLESNSAGVYLLRLQVDGILFTQKLIVSR